MSFPHTEQSHISCPGRVVALKKMHNEYKIFSVALQLRRQKRASQPRRHDSGFFIKGADAERLVSRPQLGSPTSRRLSATKSVTIGVSFYPRSLSGQAQHRWVPLEKKEE